MLVAGTTTRRQVSGQRFESGWEGPAIHNSNTRHFRGRHLRVPEGETGIDEEVALQAVRDFIARFGTRPTAESWTTAGVTPSHKTIRRRFGSFRTAIAAARMGP